MGSNKAIGEKRECGFVVHSGNQEGYSRQINMSGIMGGSSSLMGGSASTEFRRGNSLHLVWAAG